MRKTRNVFLEVVCACLMTATRVAAQPEKLGSVDFPVSCEPAVQPQFNRAVAILHSFGYQKAAEAFSAIAKRDPACGMASWGVAMTHYHALWVVPSPLDLKEGWAAVETAKAAGAKTQRERDYIAAIKTFYQDFGKLDHRTRALAYETAMEHLRVHYSKDREAAIFYALAVLANAPLETRHTRTRRKPVQFWSRFLQSSRSIPVWPTTLSTVMTILH